MSIHTITTTESA